MKCAFEFVVLYFTMIEVRDMKLGWVGSVDIYFVNAGSKSSYQDNVIYKNNYL